MASALGFVLVLATTANAQVDYMALFKGFSLQPLPIPPHEYDGTEFRYGRFVFRPAQYIPESIIFGFLIFYVTIYALGSWFNSRKANTWYNAHTSVFEAQFTRPGLPNTIISDGAADMFQHATGRRGVTSLHTIFRCLPRHDLFQIVFTYGWALYDLRYDPKDEVLLDFKLATSPNDTHGFVWGIISKDSLPTIKNERWDLTLTKTQENPTLSDELVVMSENADITETFLKHQAFRPVLQALKDPKILRHFHSLSITDQPTRRPYNGPVKPQRRQRHVYLSLSAPSSSQATDTLPLVKAVFSFIDLLESPNKFTLRPETIRKLKATREDLDKELLKDIKEEKDKEVEDEKRTAKRRAEEERIAKLSAEQQRKHMEKEKKRAQRKSQSVRVKMG